MLHSSNARPVHRLRAFADNTPPYVPSWRQPHKTVLPLLVLLALSLTGVSSHAQTLSLFPELSVFADTGHSPVARTESKRNVSPFSSVSQLEALIRAKKAQAKAHLARKEEKDDDDRDVKPVSTHEAEADRDKEKEEEEELAGTEAYEAYLYRLKQRAFPHDTIDASAYPRAWAHREQMPKALPTHPIRPEDAIAPKSQGYQANLTLPISSSSNWQFIGPTNLSVPYTVDYGQGYINGRVNALAFDPTNSNTFYLAGASGGLWKTTNGGTTWVPLSDTWPTLEVGCIAIDPTSHDTIYVGTGDFDGFGILGHGIMKSTDGGMTWTNLGADIFVGQSISAIVIDPDVPSTITVSTGRGNSNEVYVPGIWQSTDGGVSWYTRLYSFDSTNGVYWDYSDVAISAPAPGTGQRIYYAGACDDPFMNNFFESSPDRGLYWSKLSVPTKEKDENDGEAKVATSPTNPLAVYAMSGAVATTVSGMTVTYDGDGEISPDHVATGGIWYSVDNSKWVQLQLRTDITYDPYNWSQAFYDIHAACSTSIIAEQATDVFYASLIDLDQYVTQLVGLNTYLFGWNALGGPSFSNGAILHNDEHALAVNPQNANDILIGNDGGIYRLTFNPTANTWSIVSLNGPLGITQIYKMAAHPTNPNTVIAGTQDNATPYSNGNLSQWIDPGLGDGGFCAINPLNTQIQYLTVYFLSIYKTVDNWNTKTNIDPPDGGDPVEFIAPITLDPTNPNLLYGGTNHLYQYNSTTNTWQGPLGGVALTATPDAALLNIAVAPSDSNRIYTVSDDGAVFMTTNQGVTWKNISGKLLQLASFTSVAVNPTNPNNVLVGFSGSGVPHLWQCANTLATAPVWTDVSGSGAIGLPDISLNAIAIDPVNPTTTWYVGTDVGVFETLNGGKTWININNPLGLPNVEIDDLKAVPGTGYLMAGTYGRGMWRIKLTQVEQLATGGGVSSQ